MSRNPLFNAHIDNELTTNQCLVQEGACDDVHYHYRIDYRRRSGYIQRRCNRGRPVGGILIHCEVFKPKPRLEKAALGTIARRCKSTLANN